MFGKRRTIELITWATVLVLAGLAWSDDSWSSDLAAAKASAEKQGKDLLIYFTGTGECPPCQSLDQKVFSSESFREATQKDYVLVKIPVSDAADANPLVKTFKKQYGLEAAPTVFLADKSAQPYGKIDSVDVDTAAYLQRLAFERRNKPLLSSGSEWLQDYETAKAKAAAQRKHILLLFTGSDWCPGCIMMEKTIFSKPEFKELIQKHFVLMKVDSLRKSPQAPELVRKNNAISGQFQRDYGYGGLIPTMFLTLPDGTAYAQTEGRSMSPKGFAEMLIDGRQEYLKKQEAKTTDAN